MTFIQFAQIIFTIELFINEERGVRAIKRCWYFSPFQSIHTHTKDVFVSVCMFVYMCNKF